MSQLHHQVPPHLHLGQQQGLGPDMDGYERLHDELDTLGAAQDVWKRFKHVTLHVKSTGGGGDR